MIASLEVWRSKSYLFKDKLDINKVKKMKKLVMILALISGNVFAVPEIPDYLINDIAITTVRYGQVVIAYNPNYYESMGFLVRNFFRAHEYGHVNLDI
ncbi:MAG: hypothetical protein H0A75_08565 [Candidatus Methanofishera endochildressiae]|uniref:Uncharacterized protein n=1 Tax=Candidatus Methanofishera endochildressiae TaxID=2738884 RepID=A0A7Z0SE95_9GAMM|nr:hypothetical protein [Candidatus Methanofishera endochildressiae]